MIRPEPPTSPRRSRRRRRMIALMLASALAIVLGWAVMTRAANLRLYTVSGGSMAPTLDMGDRFCVDQSAGLLPARGEIWVFAMPAIGMGLPGVGVKRVIGLPGETIRVEAGKVWVDGRAVDEPYLASPITYTMPPLTLGPAEYFLLGDNRNGSLDSHQWGPVPATRLMGRLLYRVWPWRRGGGL